MSVVLLRGDARELPLPDESVDLIVCSPPYYGQRDYLDGGESLAGQIGAEDTPQDYVATLLACTREWARVLKPAGSLFVNIGDRYSAKTGAGPNAALGAVNVRPMPKSGIAPKCLMALPWRYALGCTDELGLLLRAEIIWSKLNGLPESVTDRVRRSHEQLFHFTRQPVYYSAVDEIREPHAETSIKRAMPHRSPPAAGRRNAHVYNGQPEQTLSLNQMNHPLGKLPGSVWEIATQPLTVPGSLGLDHFAAFPMELPRRIILGWSPPGVCVECGEGRRPVVAKPGLLGGDNNTERLVSGRYIASGFNGGQKVWAERMARPDYITGYACACTPYADHPERRGKSFHNHSADAVAGQRADAAGRWARYVDELENPRGPVREYGFADWNPPPTRPSVVLDPFGGTGTSALVADALGRTGISVDRSADYCRLARWRTSDPAERAKALQVPKPPPVIDGQESLFEVGA